MLEEIVELEVTAPLPETGLVDATYNVEGTVKLFDVVGAPPWVYLQVRTKEWAKPEALEEVTYERGFPMPVGGNFTIEWRPTKVGIYEVTVLATPAPLSLPVVGLFPVVAKSDVMKITVEKLGVTYSGLRITKYEVVAV